MEITEIQLSKIKSNPYQTREEIYEDSLKSLIKSIKSHGLINPISVLKDKEDYIVISGHRRLEAYKKLKFKTIPAIIKERHKDKELIFDLVHENLVREDLNPIEKGESIKLILSQIKSTNGDVERMKTLINSLKNYYRRGYIPEFKKKQTKGFKDNDIFVCEKMLKELGMSENQTIDYLSILSLPKDIKKMIIKKQISISMAEQLARVKDIEYLEHLAEECPHLRTRELEARVNKYIEKVNHGEWKGFGNYKVAGDNKFKSQLNKCHEIGKECQKLSKRLESFKIDGLLKLDFTLEGEEFISEMSALDKSIMQLDKIIKEKLKDKGFVQVRSQEEFEARITFAKKRDHYRFSLPMRIADSLNLSKEKPNFLKLKVMEIRNETGQ